MERFVLLDPVRELRLERHWVDWSGVVVLQRATAAVADVVALEVDLGVQLGLWVGVETSVDLVGWAVAAETLITAPGYYRLEVRDVGPRFVRLRYRFDDPGTSGSDVLVLSAGLGTARL